MFDHAMTDFPFSIKDFSFDHSAANSIKKEAPVSYDYSHCTTKELCFG